MASASFEKSSPAPTTSMSTPSSSYAAPLSALGVIASPFTSLYTRFSDWKAGFDLPNPGTVENLQKEVKQTQLTMMMFDGARADLTKTMSHEPVFQVAHSFTLAQREAPSAYNFNSVYISGDTLLVGGWSNDGSVSGRLNKQWSESDVSKLQMQLSTGFGGSTVLLEHDHIGRDFSATLRGINISPADLTGQYMVSYLQSVTKNLAVGAETLIQRQMPGIGLGETASSYLLKYTGARKDWIGTLTFQGMNVMHATYWQKLSEKVEVAADLQMLVAPQKRDAVATLGAKWDFRLSSFRAQLDSTGKLSALLEQRLAPAFTFTFAGEIDHLKNASKIGVGVAIESSTMTPEEMGYGPQGQGPAL